MAAISPKSGHELTREELSKGGKNSKRGPTWKSEAQKIAEMAFDDLPEITQQTIMEKTGLNLKGKTLREATILAQTLHGIAGSTPAAAYVRDTSGEKPTDKTEHSGTVEHVTLNFQKKPRQK